MYAFTTEQTRFNAAALAAAAAGMPWDKILALLHALGLEQAAALLEAILGLLKPTAPAPTIRQQQEPDPLNVNPRQLAKKTA